VGHKLAETVAQLLLGDLYHYLEAVVEAEAQELLPREEQSPQQLLQILHL
jgi:hypothetical protein